MLPKSKRFWTGMIVFQVVYGAVIFAATRAYYEDEARPPARVSVPIADPGQWRPAVSLEALQGLTPNAGIPDDPATILRLADQYYADKNYAQAARHYERLLDFDPSNPDVRNNLGLTLQYSGRTSEALAMLRESVTAHPEHQRSWLTLGFVNRQAGDLAAARRALEKAISIDAANDVGQSAQRMLDEL